MTSLVRRRRSTRVGNTWGTHSGLWALLTWLLCLPAAFALPDVVARSPFGERGAAVPIVAGVALLAIVSYLQRRYPRGPMAGVATGAFAGWVVLAMHTGLHGSPFGFIDGDTVRLSAMAERYTTTLHSSDGIVGAVPSEYPPLFPWLVGRAAVLMAVPAWQLLGPAETLLSSAVIVAGFLLWRRLVCDWLAFAAALTSFAVFLAPAKPYEWMALELVVPWALATFVGRQGRPRLGWLAAGALGGVQILLYQGYLMFFALGILALAVTGWHRAARRRVYLRHVAGTIVVSCLTGAWFLVPYLGWAVTHGLQMTDRYQDPLIDANPFPFLTVSPVGLLTATGLAGLITYRRRSWWAQPLLALTLSAYVYRFAAELQFIRNGHPMVFQYTIHAVTVTLAVAGLLTLTTAVPTLLAHLSLAPTRLGGPALTVLALWVGMLGWADWVPGAAAAQGTLGTEDSSILRSGYAPGNAFRQPLPDGTYPRFAPAAGRWPWFPTDPIISDVDSVLGPGTTPLTLSFSEQLFAFEPWPGYIGVAANAAASTEHWFSRLAALRALARVRQPTTFAAASARSPFGAIDVFILQAQGAHWDWTPINGPRPVQFTPAQFASSAFTVFRGLPDGVELAVRTSPPAVSKRSHGGGRRD
jgi:hypothetical protein